MNIIIVALLLLGVCSKASISVRVALEKKYLYLYSDKTKFGCLLHCVQTIWKPI